MHPDDLDRTRERARVARELHDDSCQRSAALGFCREVSERSRLEVRFQAEGDTIHLSEEVALCLYRVLQEALQNAAKHSGSHRVDVSLQGGATDVALTVRDSGIDVRTRHGCVAFGR